MDAAPLTPAEARILDALLLGADRAGDPSGKADRDSPPAAAAPLSPSLLRALNLSATDLLNWAASAAVAAALDTLHRTLATVDAIRNHTLRTLALDTLAALAATSPDPIEQRRAAASLLRATTPGGTGFKPVSAAQPPMRPGGTPPGGTGLRPVPAAQPPLERPAPTASPRTTPKPHAAAPIAPTPAPPRTTTPPPPAAPPQPPHPLSSHRGVQAHPHAQSDTHPDAQPPAHPTPSFARRPTRAASLLTRAGAAIHPP